jgi:hypothetical protein
MKKMKKLLILLSITGLVACNKSGNDCADGQTAMLSNLLNIIDSTHTIDDYVDLQTHEYTFTVSAPINICSIGYQGHDSNPYQMEVVDNGTVVYSGSHTFPTTQLSYVSLTNTIPLIPGNVYILRRTRLTYNNLNELVGNSIRKINNSQMSFPITQGLITFTGSNFYGAGGPLPNIALPFISFGYTNN